MEEASKKEGYKVPDSVIDDWTGEKYAKNVWCFGKEPCPPEEPTLKPSYPVPESAR